MPKEKKTEEIQINEQDIIKLFDSLIDNLLELDEIRENNKDIIKSIAEGTGYKPAIIRAAANAICKSQKDELENKHNDISSIMNMIERHKRKKVNDV